MRLLNAFYVALSIGVAAATWKFAEPLVAMNGTSVITVMSQDKKGNAPLAVKLPESLTNKQHELLAFAYDVAKSDGMKHPQYLQGIIFQESHAGNVKDYRVAGLTNAVGDRYFGIGQMKVAAAKAVLRTYPEMWKFMDTKTDEELQARLILDDKFNIRMASKYVLILGINDNPSFAITSYNRGAGGALAVENPSAFDYTVKVKAHADRLKNVQASQPVIRSPIHSNGSGLIQVASVEPRRP